METPNLRRIEKGINELRGKIKSSDYYKIFIQILFIKYATSECELIWNTHKSEYNDDYKDFLDNYSDTKLLKVDKKYFWSNIKKNTNDDLKKTLNEVFESLAKYKKKDASNLRIIDFMSFGSEINKLVEFIDNEFKYDEKKYSDIFGVVYEYFIGRYSVLEKRGGEFYTPSSVVKLMSNILGSKFIRKTNQDITIYDPTMGTGGMLIKSLEYLLENGFKVENIYLYGQEKLEEIWKIAKMNFLLRDCIFDLGNNANDTFANDLHYDKKFDIILSNPPFNLPFKKDTYEIISNDERFKEFGIVFGDKKANYNFFNHIIYHLKDNGVAAVVMQSAAGNVDKKEGEIRKKYIEKNLVEAIIGLPNKVFSNTPITSNIWIFNKEKQHKNILFLDLSEKTEKLNTQQIINDNIIEEVIDIFKKFNNNEKLEAIDFAKVISNEEILNNYDGKLSINQHIVHEQEEERVDINELKKELLDIKNELIDSSNEINKIIDALNDHEFD